MGIGVLSRRWFLLASCAVLPGFAMSGRHAFGQFPGFPAPQKKAQASQQSGNAARVAPKEAVEQSPKLARTSLNTPVPHASQQPLSSGGYGGEIKDGRGGEPSGQVGAALEARLGRIEQMIFELQEDARYIRAVVNKLDVHASTPTDPAAAASAEGGWQNRANWRKLKIGMLQDDVERLLGPAKKVDADAFWIDWDYTQDEFRATVRFSRQGFVNEWKEP